MFPEFSLNVPWMFPEYCPSAVYFIQMGLMRGESLGHIRQTLKDNFLDTILAETAYWPLLDAINFKFLPVWYVCQQKQNKIK
jgi:hypothetical protein